MTSVPVSKVSILRANNRQLKSRTGKTINVSTRRQFLINTLFGKEYSPGPNLPIWLNEQMIDWPDVAKDHIQDFYIYGRKLHKNTRIYRTALKKILKENITESIENLIKNEVIIHAE
jgi:hypothetical protein